VNTSDKSKCLHLNRDQRDEAVEQPNDVQEPTGDLLRDNDRRVVVLRIALPLDVPVFEGADDVRFIGLSELDLDFEATIRIGILAKQV
jgi:hypothetical protein